MFNTLDNSKTPHLQPGKNGKKMPTPREHARILENFSNAAQNQFGIFSLTPSKKGAWGGDFSDILSEKEMIFKI